MSLKFSGFSSVSALDTIVGLAGGANAITTRSQFKTALSLVKGDVGLGNVDNTSDATKNAASVTLTNKTISGASNTLSNIGNSSLTNSAITIAGTSKSLGGSIATTTILDGLGTVAWGSILFRGTSDWQSPVGDDGKVLMGKGANADPVFVGVPVVVEVACSDTTTDIASGTDKVTFRMPFAMTVTAVRASVSTAPVGSTIIIDINESGTTILSTKLSIDASEKTSTTAATPPVISDAALADDAEMTIDFDQVGSGTPGKGVVVSIIGTKP